MIKFINVSKKYNNDYAIKDVCFEISKGGLYIFNGDNGSGKSTILKLLSGIIYKNDGVIINTYTTSFLPEKITLPKLISTKKYLDIILNRETNSIFEKYNIPKDKKIYELSKGNYAKLLIAQILNTDYDCYIFDEPLDGLDEFAKILFKEEIINKINNKKVVIMSLHDNDLFNDLEPKIFHIKNGVLNEQ